MNMIPLVMANEPGRAQLVNPCPRALNCSLEVTFQCGPGHKYFWKKSSERVRIPSVARSSIRTDCFR